MSLIAKPAPLRPPGRLERRLKPPPRGALPLKHTNHAVPHQQVPALAPRARVRQRHSDNRLGPNRPGLRHFGHRQRTTTGAGTGKTGSGKTESSGSGKEGASTSTPEKQKPAAAAKRAAPARGARAGRAAAAKRVKQRPARARAPAQKLARRNISSKKNNCPTFEGGRTVVGVDVHRKLNGRNAQCVLENSVRRYLAATSLLALAPAAASAHKHPEPARALRDQHPRRGTADHRWRTGRSNGPTQMHPATQSPAVRPSRFMQHVAGTAGYVPVQSTTTEANGAYKFTTAA